MLKTVTGYQGMVTAPHHLASQAGVSVLRDGGNAVEAMVAMAAAIAVVYPHMTAIGGDGFWLIAEPGKSPIGIDACGAAAENATRGFYTDQGYSSIPTRGQLAALTAAGTISGWEAALAQARAWGTAMPLERLMQDAVRHAHEGVAVAPSQEALTREKLAELKDAPGFAETFLQDGAVPAARSKLANPRLGDTLKHLGKAGLADFYSGELAGRIADDLAAVGSPVSAADLRGHAAKLVTPLSVQTGDGALYNMTPPTQGLASLIILALYDRLTAPETTEFDFVHRLVEATKRAFIVRDGHVTDPAYMTADPQEFLTDAFLDAEAAKIDLATALPWPHLAAPGDTIWMGAIDGEGRAVSFIQSIYWEFGSGVVLPETGILWQNRGISFSLEENGAHPLLPGRKPFHTLNPPMAILKDGRTISYGTMGGEGQPQTQAALYARYVKQGIDLQDAISSPRWLLGRTWGDQSTNLKLESRFDAATIEALKGAGHDVAVVDPMTDMMGHAGAIVHHPDGLFEGATDPRSDGAAMAV